jgi:hypothetical protein
MKNLAAVILILSLVSVFIVCERNKGIANNDEKADFSGIYCLNVQNIEIIITRTDDHVTFSMMPYALTDATGAITGDTLRLSGVMADSRRFSCVLAFSEDRRSFTGPFYLTDGNGNPVSGGRFRGAKGECPQYDIAAEGIPQFVGQDFTQLSKIEKISKFRSGFGHSFTDGTEACRSMKHYYDPFVNYRLNNSIEIYSPVNGSILSVTDDGHGASVGLTNKQIQIRADDQPAFIFVLFHCDLASSAVAEGKKIHAGELLAYARMFYPDLGEYASSFDIAVWVNTPSGPRLVPYFDTLKDAVFNGYAARGALSRKDFTITRASRDADSLRCSGETFLTGGNMENWVVLK